MQNTIKTQIEETTLGIREVSLRDAMTFNRITIDLLRAAKYGESKSSLLLQFLFTEYVEQANNDEGVYLTTLAGLSEAMKCSENAVRCLLDRIAKHQDRTGITLVTWAVPKYKDEKNRWRSEGHQFKLLNMLDAWIDIKNQAFADPSFEEDRYMAIGRAARKVIAQRNWEPTRRTGRSQDRTGFVAELIKRTKTRADMEGCRENVESLIEVMKRDFLFFLEQLPGQYPSILKKD
jgi:hypothetical protein